VQDYRCIEEEATPMRIMMGAQGQDPSGYQNLGGQDPPQTPWLPKLETTQRLNTLVPIRACKRRVTKTHYLLLLILFLLLLIFLLLLSISITLHASASTAFKYQQLEAASLRVISRTSLNLAASL
jgi:hypothetical protein